MSTASWVKNVGGPRSCNCSTEGYKFSPEEMPGAQNFDYTPEFLRNWGVRPKVCFLVKNFPTRKKFPDNFPTAQTLGVGNCTLLLNATTPFNWIHILNCVEKREVVHRCSASSDSSSSMLGVKQDVELMSWRRRCHFISSTWSFSISSCRITCRSISTSEAFAHSRIRSTRSSATA